MCPETMNLMKAYGIQTLSSQGFFHDLYEFSQATGGPVIPFLTVAGTDAELDRYYYFVQSGDKTASKILRMFYDEETGLSSDDRRKIASSFWEVYGLMLLREWANYTVQYDPENQYDVYEETDYTHEADGRMDDARTEDITYQGSETNALTGDDTTSKVYGFDSSTSVGAGETLHGATNTLTFSEGRTDAKSYGGYKTTEDSSTDDLDTHKYGRLGTISMGELMGREIQVWMWNFYTQCLFPAVDKMLTIPIY